MTYSGFERQTAIALASKFNSYLSKLSESDLEVGKGSFDYDYSFLKDYELSRVLSLASYDLGFTYQFAYSKKEPGKIFYTRSNGESEDSLDFVLPFLVILYISLIVVLIFLAIHRFAC